MWLNLLIVCAASLITGFIVGYVFACPKRWDTRPWGELPGPLPDRDAELSHLSL